VFFYSRNQNFEYSAHSSKTFSPTHLPKDRIRTVFEPINEEIKSFHEEEVLNMFMNDQDPPTKFLSSSFPLTSSSHPIIIFQKPQKVNKNSKSLSYFIRKNIDENQKFDTLQRSGLSPEMMRLVVYDTTMFDRTPRTAPLNEPSRPIFSPDMSPVVSETKMLDRTSEPVSPNKFVTKSDRLIFSPDMSPVVSETKMLDRTSETASPNEFVTKSDRPIFSPDMSPVISETKLLDRTSEPVSPNKFVTKSDRPIFSPDMSPVISETKMLDRTSGAISPNKRTTQPISNLTDDTSGSKKIYNQESRLIEDTISNGSSFVMSARPLNRSYIDLAKSVPSNKSMQKFKELKMKSINYGHSRKDFSTSKHSALAFGLPTDTISVEKSINVKKPMANFDKVALAKFIREIIAADFGNKLLSSKNIRFEKPILEQKQMNPDCHDSHEVKILEITSLERFLALLFLGDCWRM
jgi:hypothetical protein